MNKILSRTGVKVEMGKLNDYAINMLLAKMYLNHNAWFNDYSDNSYYGKAIDEVNEVINSGKFSLVISGEFYNRMNIRVLEVS